MENYFKCTDEDIEDDNKVTISIESFMDYAETHIHFESNLKMKPENIGLLI